MRERLGTADDIAQLPDLIIWLSPTHSSPEVPDPKTGLVTVGGMLMRPDNAETFRAHWRRVHAERHERSDA